MIHITFYRFSLLLLTAFLPLLAAQSQISSGNLQQFIEDEKKTDMAGLRFAAALKDFYALRGYQPVWVQDKRIRTVLLNDLSSASSGGLDEKDYQFEFIKGWQKADQPLPTLNDSLRAELLFTDAALHYYNDIAHGNTRPSFGFNGLKDVPVRCNIPALLHAHSMNGQLPALANKLEATLPEISVLGKMIRYLVGVVKDSGFHEVRISSAKVAASNTPLVEKLFQLGIADRTAAVLTDSLLKLKIKEAQQLFNILADGVLRPTTLQELNVPIQKRLKMLQLSLNYYRWLYSLAASQSVIVVNIPATILRVYRGNHTELQMKLIVGKRSTPTPTLISTVKEVILYPYWHVPYSIATKELLPAIRANPGYIDAGNYQVLNSAGRIMDPYAINWHAVSAGNFPYTIRQSTGCDNALGLIKLNFYNPFGVYLHDTPKKSLFATNERFYSHGCMRMEKPMELGHLVLKNNPKAIDTLEQKGCLRNQSPIYVKADVQMPVVVWYNPAGIGNTGRLVFYRDVYGKFD
jgi:L,D-transpeptidase YcbB